MDMTQLIASVKEEASREAFPIDTEVYQSAGIDPHTPILFYGNLNSPICFFARDLGKDEVHARQPLYGSAGKLVRKAVYQRLFGKETNDVKELQKAADQILLTNTVPYKPPGNKAYHNSVKERFRPFLEQFLMRHWTGSYIITLGTEAFKWFSPYAAKGVLDNFFEQENRYESELAIELRCKGKEEVKKVTLSPLPHPSPLNKQYYHLFPGLLEKRLEANRTKFKI